MAKTIYTYLHNDDLKGSRIVSIDDCMCKLYNIVRNDIDFMQIFEKDLQFPALYVLINKEMSKAYIGETDDFIKRIYQHILKKDFWSEVMVFLGTNEDTLSKTEVQYLEYLAIEKAKEVNLYDLSENTQGGKKPHMNLMQKGKSDKFFEYVQFLAKFVQCDIFGKQEVVVSTAPLSLPKEKNDIEKDNTNKVSKEEQLLTKYFCLPNNTDLLINYEKQPAVIQNFLESKAGCRLSSRLLGLAMKKMGFEKKRKMVHGKQIYVYSLHLKIF